MSGIYDSFELRTIAESESGYSIDYVLGNGVQSVAYCANNGNGKNVCLKVSLVDDNCEYYMQSIVANQFAGNRKVDLPIQHRGSFCLNDKAYEYLITEIAKPVTQDQYNRLCDRLVRHNIIFPDDGYRQCGKVGRKLYIVDYNSIVSIKELPANVQKLCRYIKRTAKTLDWHERDILTVECNEQLRSMGYKPNDWRDSIALFVECWINTRRLYKGYSCW